MELRQLRYFQSIARLKSLSKASRELNITQPALTRQIRGLERDLEVELFHRHSRGMELTAAGLLLLDKTDRVMADIRRIRKDLLSCDEVFRRVRIGVSPGAAQLLMPAVIAALRQRDANIEFLISEGDTATLHNGLKDEFLDVAITHQHRSILGLDCIPILAESMFLVSAPSSSPGREISVREMLELPLIAPSSPNGLRQFIADSFADKNYQFSPAVEVNGYAVLKALLSEGGLHAILSYNSVSEEVRRGELAITAIKDMPRQFRLEIVKKTENCGDKTLELLGQIARERAAALVHSNRWHGELI